MNNSIRGYKIIYLKKVLFTSIKCTVALCAKRPVHLTLLPTLVICVPLSSYVYRFRPLQ